MSRSRPPRIIAVHLRSLPLETVFADAPVADERAVAIRELSRGRATLVAVSEAALAAGVVPGMSEAEGRATHGELVVREREPALEIIRLERAAELLFAYGPEVEVCPPSTLFVEIGRSRAALRKRFGDEVREEAILEHLVADLGGVGHRVTAALADDPDTARSFAEHLADRVSVRACAPRGRKDMVEPKEIWVVPAGGSRRELGRLPVTALAWTDRASDPEGRFRRRLHASAEALRVLGIRDVRGLARLPPAEMGSRFGEAGTCLAERAVGRRRRPLRRHVPPERLEEDYELEAATEDLEPILFILRRLLHRLAARLSARQRAASALTLDILVEPGLERRVALDEARPASSKRREAVPVRFARPTRDADAMLAIVREKIGAALPGAVLAIRVVAEQPETDRGAQLDLFSRRTQRAEALGELVGRLGAALGDAAVFSPSLADTHRPEEAWTREPFRVDAALAPARPPARPPVSSFTPRVVDGAEMGERPLPVVDEGFSVVQPALAPETETASEEAWPKPRPRRPEDEPPPPLPPRPIELLDPPEPARFQEARTVLSWRGRRHPIRDLSGREHLRTEWWRRQPLERDYLTVETEDGRGLWVYVTPQGAAFVHGLFD